MDTNDHSKQGPEMTATEVKKRMHESFQRERPALLGFENIVVEMHKIIVKAGLLKR